MCAENRAKIQKKNEIAKSGAQKNILFISERKNEQL